MKKSLALLLAIIIPSLAIASAYASPYTKYTSSYDSMTQYNQQLVRKALSVLEALEYSDYRLNSLVDAEYIRQGLSAFTDPSNYSSDLDQLWGASKIDRIMAYNRLYTALSIGLLTLSSSYGF